MDLQKEIEARVKAVIGELNVQLIVAVANVDVLTKTLEASQVRIKELESAAGSG